MRQLELTLGLEAPKNWLWLQVPGAGIAPSHRWGHLQYSSPDLDPDSEKKKSPKVSWRPDPRLWSKATAPGSVHRTARGHGHPRSSSGWPAGNLAFTSSSALLGLLCPHLALSKTCFCPPKNTEPDLVGTGEQRSARERLSRGTKFACPSF